MAFDPQLTLQDLLTAETDTNTVFQSLVNNLKTAGFPVTDWNDGGVALTILQIDSAQIANTNQVISDLAAAGFITLAPGNPDGATVTNQTWLDLTGDAQYDERRILAVFGQYEVQLTTASGFGPYTIAANGLHFTDPTGAYRYQSTNAAPVTIGSGSPTKIVVQAEAAGAAYNTISSPSTSLTFVTPLLGVTAETVLAPGSSTTAAVVSGADIEGDDAYRSRCIDKWATLSVSAVVAAMTFYAESVVSTHGTVSNVLVDDSNPRGPGTVDIYIATAAGAAPSGLVTDVDAVLQTKKPLTSDLDTISATADTVNVTATCYVPASLAPTYSATVTSKLASLQSSLPIGDGSGAGTVYFSAIMQVLMDAGARNVESLSPGTDTVPAKGHVSVLTNGISVVSV